MFGVVVYQVWYCLVLRVGVLVSHISRAFFSWGDYLGDIGMLG